MKIFTKWLLCSALVLIGASPGLHAAQTERLISFSLTGFNQAEDNFGNPKAVPFRAGTREILEEINFSTGAPVTNGVLLMVESLDDTNAPIRIVARKGTSDFDVTDLFEFFEGDAVATEVGTRATFYAIDQLVFSTLNIDTNGIALEFQGFTQETHSLVVKRLGSDSRQVNSKNFSTTGNGEIRFSDNVLLGPVKGTVKIGPPKLVATPIIATAQHGLIISQGSSYPPPLPFPTPADQ